jgi:hypothetical protein
MEIRLPQRVSTHSPITLTDGLGRVVYSSAFKTGEQVKNIDTKELTAGVYVLRIEAGKEATALKKVMIVHQP